jgi:hypothetical protein
MSNLTTEQCHEAGMARRVCGDLAAELAVIRWLAGGEPYLQDLHVEWAFDAYDRLVAYMATLPRPVKADEPEPDDEPRECDDSSYRRDMIDAGRGHLLR